jgi:hypothetical protein
MRFAAFLAPEAGHSARDGGASTVRAWRRIWEMTYGDGTPPPPGDLNLKGWRSSYTGQPMPEGDMRQWVEATVRYLGIDIASVAIRYTAQEVDARGLGDRVELAVGEAANAAAERLTVVLWSVW